MSTATSMRSRSKKTKTKTKKAVEVAKDAGRKAQSGAATATGKKRSTGKKAKAVPRSTRPGRRSGVAYFRRTFMFDERTDLIVGQIQEGLSASTASEAMRTTLRRMAKLMQFVAKGGVIRGVLEDLVIELDFPAWPNTTDG